MTALTPEAVAKHAETWPTPLLKRNTGLWRFNDSAGQAAPMLLFARVFCDELEIREPRLDSAWQAYRSDDWPGAWTPVRPDGSDVPGLNESYERGRAEGRAEERAAMRGSIAEAIERAMAEHDDLIDELNGCLDLIAQRVGLDPDLATMDEIVRAVDAAYERGLLDGRAQDREELIEAKRKAGEQARRIAALEEGWHELRAKHGGCAGWIRKLEQERDAAYQEGREAERAAIVAGLEWIAQTWRGCSETALADGDPAGTAQTYRERGKAVEMACDRLKAGEWSVK